MSWNDLPGLGTATGTRVDSAAKHIMACKVDTRLLAHWIASPEGGDAINALHNEKMKWCMHKDEIVLNTSKNHLDPAVKAYPMVITTVGDIKPEVVKYLTYLYSQSNASDFFDVQDIPEPSDDRTRRLKVQLGCVDAEDEADAFDASKWNPILHQLKSLPDFRCQGIALGQAWASYLSGDTVASVLVGGMVTVQNGHFTMHTGDMVQWYFDWEHTEFDSTNRKTNGFRQPLRVDPEGRVDRNQKREKYMDERLYGSKPTLGRSSGHKDTTRVVRIKSYRMHNYAYHDGHLFCQDHFGDKIRVFAKCISGGRPYDAVDIMLMTQSL
jgi:hypothetical protein